MNKPILIVKAKHEEQAEGIKSILKEQGVYEQFIVLIYGGELDITLDGKTISPHNQIPYVPPCQRANIERPSGVSNNFFMLMMAIMFIIGILAAIFLR